MGQDISATGSSVTVSGDGARTSFEGAIFNAPVTFEAPRTITHSIDSVQGVEADDELVDKAKEIQKIIESSSKDTKNGDSESIKEYMGHAKSYLWAGLIGIISTVVFDSIDNYYLGGILLSDNSANNLYLVFGGVCVIPVGGIALIRRYLFQ